MLWFRKWLTFQRIIYHLQALFAVYFFLLLCLAYSLAQKFWMICSSKTLTSLETTWHYNPKDHAFHSHCCEHLKSKRVGKCISYKGHYSDAVILCMFFIQWTWNVLYKLTLLSVIILQVKEVKMTEEECRQN